MKLSKNLVFIVLLSIIALIVACTFAEGASTKSSANIKAQKPMTAKTSKTAKPSNKKPINKASQKVKVKKPEVIKRKTAKTSSDPKKTTTSTTKDSKSSISVESQKSPSIDRSVLKLFSNQQPTPILQQQPAKTRTIAETLKLLNKGAKPIQPAKPVQKISTQSIAKPSIIPSSNQVIAKPQPKEVTKPKPKPAQKKCHKPKKQVKKPKKKLARKPKKHTRKAPESRVNISNLINVNAESTHHKRRRHHKRRPTRDEKEKKLFYKDLVNLLKKIKKNNQ